MNSFWDYFWPLAAVGLVIGLASGVLAFRRRRTVLIAAGLVLALALAGLWHGPLGAADRLATKVERTARFVLVDWEMGGVRAQLHRGPLTRTLLLSGPADDFQRSELVRMMSTIPGVSRATWSPERKGVALIVEGALAAIAGFLVGLLLAYGIDLRRRYNAQWKW